MIRVLCFLLLLTPHLAQALPIMADLALRKIEIDSGFQGQDILLYGARNDAGNVVVVVRGPKTSFVVRQKERIPGLGIWVNRQQMQFDGVDGFYAIASNRPLGDLRNNYLLERLNIDNNRTFFLEKLDTEKEKQAVFSKALLESKRTQGLYKPKIENVSFIGDMLFRTLIHFPDNIPRGMYTAEVYLFSEGQLMGMQTLPLTVKKRGLDAWIFDFAYHYPALYGIFAILLALGTGLIASSIFRKI